MPKPRNSERSAYSQPQIPVRIGLGVIALFAGTIAAWSAFAPLSDAAIASGVLQVEGRRQEVQHPYGGVVRKLDVREGDTVEKGQVLITISDIKPKADLEVLANERARLTAVRARLIAERDGLRSVDMPIETLEGDNTSELVAGETAILETRNRQHAASIEVVRRKIDQSREQIVGTEAQVASLQRQAELSGEELVAARKLLEQGYAPRPRVLALERATSEMQAARSSKLAEISAARQAMAQGEAEIARLDRARSSALAEELNAADAKLAELKPRIATAEDTLKFTSVIAPASGRVVELAVFTEGGVIEPGARLMTIVPSDTPFFVDARLRLNELHGISPGQDAEIEMLSTPRRERPKINGTVRVISADRIVDQQSGEGFYALQIEINQDDVAKSGVSLQAGMPAQVIMATEPRTLIDYLTSPLLDEVSTAFREH